MECLAHTTTIYIAHNVVVDQFLGPVAKSCGPFAAPWTTVLQASSIEINKTHMPTSRCA